jgi:hypothetical protein
LHDLHEIDPEQNETALQVYISSYRSLNADEPREKHDPKFALLRKASRLDLVIPSATVTASTKACCRCDIDVSPRWYPIDSKHEMDVDGREEGSLLCHQCWYHEQA